MAETLRPCVFLDRDGTVTREAGYINHPDRIELLPGAAAAIKRLNKAGILAILTTNQAGLARGYFDEAVMKAVFDRLNELLAKQGARLDAIYCSPHHPSAKDERWRDDPDQMRKPGIGMIRQACREHPIDMARSYVVGDKHIDVIFASRAGIPGVMVMSGYGLGEYTYKRDTWTEQPAAIADDINGAVHWILKDMKEKERNAKDEVRRAGKEERRAKSEGRKKKNAKMGEHQTNGNSVPSNRAYRSLAPAHPADAVVTREEAARFGRAAQAAGKKVVFANGCFDILHGGHISYLNDARAEGDVLIVGVNSDASERAIKGAGRPVMPGVERAELLAGMEAVDRVVIFEEETAEACLREIRPDVHAKGTDYSAETVPERAIAAELGIRVAITGDPKQNASKLIMKQIREGEAG